MFSHLFKMYMSHNVSEVYYGQKRTCKPVTCTMVTTKMRCRTMFLIFHLSSPITTQHKFVVFLCLILNKLFSTLASATTKYMTKRLANYECSRFFPASWTPSWRITTWCGSNKGRRFYKESVLQRMAWWLREFFKERLPESARTISHPPYSISDIALQWRWLRLTSLPLTWFNFPGLPQTLLHHPAPLWMTIEKIAFQRR